MVNRLSLIFTLLSFIIAGALCYLSYLAVVVE
ncbi:hypothetical protein KIPB_014441, partial [Kipferlia bialata]|eukprot:g14441.t1